MPVGQLDVERFAALFDGNERSHGIWNPRNGRMHTDPKQAALIDYEEHVNGKRGLGIVPIRDDGRCMFGAIDIDNHGSKVDLPIEEAEAARERNRLPIVLCRSKSGGIHGYLFLTSPTPATLVRTKLTQYAQALGYPNAEIFPKQGKVGQDADGKQLFGNWINLPYYDAEASTRYSVDKEGERLSFTEFLDLAESRLTPEEALSGVLGTHPEAPPCIQRLMDEGIDSGVRNEGLYNVVVYFRKAFPDDYRDRAFDANNQFVNPPLPMVEARRTVASAGRRDYKYKCDEEPIKSRCNRAVCLQRRFGVGSTDQHDGKQANSALPAFTELTKFLTEPIRWSVKMDGVVVDNLETEDILRYSRMERIIIERLGRGAPMIKERDWREILNVLLDGHKVEAVPDDASTPGIMRARLVEFVKKAAFTGGMDEFDDDRSVLLRGLPILYRVPEGTSTREYVAFRGQDFIDHLRRTKSEDIRGTNLWFAIRGLGIEQHNIRVGTQVLKAWCIPMNEEWRQAIKPAIFGREF